MMYKFGEWWFWALAVVCFLSGFFTVYPDPLMVNGFGWVFLGISMILGKLNGG